MRISQMWLRIFLLCVGVAAAGCGVSPKPTDIEAEAALGSTLSWSTTVTSVASPVAPRAMAAAAVGERFGFEPFQAYPIGDWRDSEMGKPDTTAIGDVTGDGRDDVVMVTLRHAPTRPLPIDYQVFVYAQSPDGSLQAPVMHPFNPDFQSGHYTGSGLVLADLNQDGVKDIVVGYGAYLHVLLSLGGNSFALSRRPIVIPDDFPWANVTSAVAADMDQDGLVDIVTHNFPQHGSVFYGDGRGSFSQVKFLQTPVIGITDVTSGDVNRDGFADVMVAAGQRPALKFWFVLSGRHRMATPSAIHALPDEVGGFRGAAIGDWDRDGINELAFPIFRNMSADGVPAGLLIYTESAPLQFTRSLFVPTLDCPLALISGDFDGDRIDDLLIDHHGWQNIGLFTHEHGFDGDEALFGTPPYSTASWNPKSISAGDMNGDGCTDVAMADSNFGLVILRGRNCLQLAPPLPDERGFNMVRMGE